MKLSTIYYIDKLFQEEKERICENARSADKEKIGEYEQEMRKLNYAYNDFVLKDWQ